MHLCFDHRNVIVISIIMVVINYNHSFYDFIHLINPVSIFLVSIYMGIA